MKHRLWFVKSTTPTQLSRAERMKSCQNILLCMIFLLLEPNKERFERHFKCKICT